MEIRVLRYFLVVAREENITKAAEALHITQPTLSRQLAQLEEETGVKLFDRSYHKIVLTEEGILLKQRAQEIVELADRTLEDLLIQDNEIEGTIIIGAGALRAMDKMAELMESFRKLYPKVVFHIITGSVDDISDQLERGGIDLGVMLEPFDKSRYEYLDLNVKEVFCALMRRDDPLAERDYVTRDDLLTRTLTLPLRLNVQSVIYHWFQMDYTHLNIGYHINLSENSLYTIHRGNVIGFMSEGSLPYLDERQFKKMPLQPELSSTTVVVWRRETSFNKPVQKFIEFLQGKLS